MKHLVIALALLASSGAFAASQTHVDGHFRKDGTYVPPHYRTTPDGRLDNNWSSRGQVNPWTGERGYVDPYQPQNPYGQQPRRRQSY